MGISGWVEEEGKLNVRDDLAIAVRVVLHDVLEGLHATSDDVDLGAVGCEGLGGHETCCRRTAVSGDVGQFFVSTGTYRSHCHRRSRRLMVIMTHRRVSGVSSISPPETLREVGKEVWGGGRTGQALDGEELLCEEVGRRHFQICE